MGFTDMNQGAKLQKVPQKWVIESVSFYDSFVLCFLFFFPFLSYVFCFNIGN